MTTKIEQAAREKAKEHGWSPDGGIFMEGFESGARYVLERAKDQPYLEIEVCPTITTKKKYRVVILSDLEELFEEEK